MVDITLNLDHHRKDHRPAMGSVIDHLSEFVMQVLLYELDLDDLVPQEVPQNPIRLLAQLVEQPA
jgi:hypothetical protein